MKRPAWAHPAKLAALFFSLATLLLAAALIFQCAAIYRTGTSAENLTETGVYIHDVYSRQIIAERFSQISWVFILWLAALVAVLICRKAWPSDKREPATISPQDRLKLMLKRVERTPDMLAQQRKRRIAAIACAAVCIVCTAMVCSYLLNLEHFASRELEGVMGAMLLSITPWILLAFAALLALAQVRESSILREIEAAKAAPKRKPEPQGEPKNGLVLAGRIALLVCAIAMIVAGVLNGGMYDVLVKAINICTECIGLG